MSIRQVFKCVVLEDGPQIRLKRIITALVNDGTLTSPDVEVIWADGSKTTELGCELIEVEANNGVWKGYLLRDRSVVNVQKSKVLSRCLMGDLVYDPRLNLIGMIMRVEGKSVLSAVTQEEIDDSGIMFYYSETSGVRMENKRLCSSPRQ